MNKLRVLDFFSLKSPLFFDKLFILLMVLYTKSYEKSREEEVKMHTIKNKEPKKIPLQKMLCSSSYIEDAKKKIKMRLSCFASVISKTLCPYEKDLKHNIKKSRVLLANIFTHTLLSFFLALVKIPFSLSPFGLSVLCCASKSNIFFCYAGVALSSLFAGIYSPLHFITYTFLYLLYSNFENKEITSRLSTRLIACVISSSFIGAVRLFTKAISFDECFAFLTYISLSAIGTYLFYPLFCKESKNTKDTTHTLSLYAVCVCLVPAANSLSIFSINTGLIYAGTLTIIFALSRGPLYSCVAGFMAGFLCLNPQSAAPLGIAGLICGYLFPKGAFFSLLSFCLCTFFTGIYISGAAAFTEFFPYSICSVLVFLIIKPYIPKIFFLSSSSSSAEKAPKAVTNTNFDNVSESLSGLSSIIYKLSEHMKAPASQETCGIIDSAFDSVCATCSLSSMCFAKKECNYPQMRQSLCAILRTGKLSKDELDKKLLCKCIKPDELTNYINAHYSDLCFLTMKANRTGTVAGMYSSMSRLIKAASKDTANENARDSKLEKALGEALKKIGIDYSFITAKGLRTKEICVHGIRADKIPCSSKDISLYLSKLCKTKFTEPSFDISDCSDMVMKLERGEIISTEYAQCACSAKYDEVNGDTITFFDTDKSYFYSLIADGMGSGKPAAVTSRLSCIFLQKLLSAGTAKNVSLEMLNNLLLSKNDETFSSIDLLEIDKLEGSAYFIKAGAAPSFILRNSRLYKISSKTPPVGIIHSFSAESTRFFLQKGDIIIMVSDGIIQSEADAIWISELINQAKQKEPCILAKQIIDKAKQIDRHPDDCSCVVIKII